MRFNEKLNDNVKGCIVRFSVKNFWHCNFLFENNRVFLYNGLFQGRFRWIIQMLSKKYVTELQNDITDSAISHYQMYKVSAKAALSDLRETKTFQQFQKKPDIVVTTLLDEEVSASLQALIGLQSVAGYWLFPLETDTTITSDYILLAHFIEQVDKQLEGRLVKHILSEQLPCGGWPI